MDNKFYNKKYDLCNKEELLKKILNAETGRQNEINKLYRELRTAEEQCDTDKIDEIINKLNIVDPIAENADDFGYLEYLDYLDAQKTQQRLKSRRSVILKITAACAAVFIGLQITFYAAFNINIANRAYSSALNVLSNIVNKNTDNTGISANPDDSDNSNNLDDYAVLENEDFGIRQYDTVEEFEQAENISLFGSYALPDDMKVRTVIYYYNYSINQVNILFEDNTSMSVKLSSESIRNVNNYVPSATME